MKRIFKVLLSVVAMLFMATSINAQAPGVTWDGFYPGDYEEGNYTANDIKLSPYGGYVLAGSRRMLFQSYGYKQVMLMRVDEEGGGIWMQQTFEGTSITGIPWDQEAYDMIFTPLPHITYLVTGYRDTTLTSAETPAGLFLMEITGLGIVNFDSLYFNYNQDQIVGRCIQPAIGGGYIIAGSIREDGGGTEKIMLTRLVKNEDGKYEHTEMPFLVINPVGEGGYASWIRQFGDGYLLGGSAFNGNNKYDLFIRKIDEELIEDWTLFYGMEDSDEFADALISTNHVYLAGSASVPVTGTSYYNDQIYVVKIDATGEVVWEETYGGTTRHYANNIIMSEDGNLLVAGIAYDLSMHSEMVLLKIDAETGDSLWMQSYGDFHNAGIGDAIHSSDFGYMVTGRASYTSTQDPRVYIMKLDNSPERANLFLAKEDLSLEIVTGTPTKDVIDVTADKIALYGICVKIDSLLHPSVGDLEITLEHAGTTVTLVDQPFHSGENFIHIALIDAAEAPVESGYAPYTGWFRPEEPLLPFLLHEPTGKWTLTITDHGTGGLKSTRVLEGWSLNLLVESGTGLGVPTLESLANFGLEQVRPNPFNQEALISFRIPEPGHVKVMVYNQVGQLVGYLANEYLPEGVHERMWYPKSLAPGTYFIHLESGGMVSVRKAVLAR
ncbi:MAG: T9SS type A sorting domain-containing protein [Bacteroidales bacterium]|nr:T9SS type A sorting domain-containing protein [Bacteroidales bacterium]